MVHFEMGFLGFSKEALQINAESLLMNLFYRINRINLYQKYISYILYRLWMQNMNLFIYFIE